MVMLRPAEDEMVMLRPVRATRDLFGSIKPAEREAVIAEARFSSSWSLGCSLDCCW
jgi:hypothetical protein